MASDAGNRQSGSVFVPAPIAGLNTTDAHGVMDGKYAFGLVNFLPMENGLVIRGGSLPHYSGDLGGEVRTLMTYKAASVGSLFAVSGGTIWDVTSGAQDPTPVYAGLSSSAAQWVNFSNNGGTFLWLCNGVDNPVYFDGTAWQQATLTGAAGVRFSNVCVYQSRLWMVAPGTLDLYYLDMDAIQGAVHKLPLGAYLDRGGSLLLVGNLTADGGEGPDDYLIVVTDQGEAVSFQGRNPDSASSWYMSGRFQFARPMGLRSMCKFGGDLVLLTEYGVAGVASMLSNELAGVSGSATEKIQPTWANIARGRRGSDGWQIIVYHRRGLILVNVPDTLGGYMQFVFNPQTKAWGELRGWNCGCLLEADGEVYGGETNLVRHLDIGLSDVTGETAHPVEAIVQHAFIFPGGKGSKKRYTLMRPYISSDMAPQVRLGIAMDNNPAANLAEMYFDEAADIPPGAEWNTAEWEEAEWNIRSSSLNTHTRWINVWGTGYSVSPALYITPEAENTVYSGVDLQYQLGNSL